MCVAVRTRAMGCGKSKHRSLEDSEIDIKQGKNSNHGNSKNGSSNTKKDSSSKDSGGSGGSSSSASSSTTSSWSTGGGKKKKHFNDNKTSHKDGGDKEEKSSPFKILSNGKSNRNQGGGRCEEVGVPAGLSASGKTTGSGAEKSNGTVNSNNKSYALEIPNEISKPEPQQKTTCRDFKSLTSSKTVHVTNSQIEFFKMLDEKIEKGDGYTTSADVSEVSSLDENFRH